ncbi:MULTISPECIES: flavoprotein [Streptomyces]|uniref:flavoprotein n=1 Tax=Streptomyces TaxID=1883 RepID=UPI0036B21C2F
MSEPKRRVLLYGTGAIGVALLPTCITWLRSARPDLEMRILLTHSASQFVSARALRAIGNCEVQIDRWESTDEEPGGPHMELADWPDLVLVYPATTHFISRFALGLADTPGLLALQSTRAPVVIAPSLPTGCLDNDVVKGHLAAAGARRGVTVLPTTDGLSVAAGTATAGAPLPFPEAWKEAERTWPVAP